MGRNRFLFINGLHASISLEKRQERGGACIIGPVNCYFFWVCLDLDSRYVWFLETNLSLHLMPVKGSIFEFTSWVRSISKLKSHYWEEISLAGLSRFRRFPISLVFYHKVSSFCSERVNNLISLVDDWLVDAAFSSKNFNGILESKWFKWQFLQFSSIDKQKLNFYYRIWNV